MCGIVGVIHATPRDRALTDANKCAVSSELHNALFLLQHRGQDACGIVTCGDPRSRIYQCKGNGLASKVFDEGKRLHSLPGWMGLGHLRYPTAGTSANSEAQPLYVNSPYGICFTHNGNLINSPQLRKELDQEAHRHINTESDSELMLNIFANELNETGKARVNSADVFAALERMSGKCVGGWACTAMIAGFGIIGFRDAYGIRPLVLGWRQSDIAEGEDCIDYMLASESVALVQCGYKNFVDVKPGQAVIIEKGKKPVFQQVARQERYAPDIFEYVYFARPDTIIDGIDVDESRREMGKMLAATIRKQLGEATLAEIDVVMPIPETSNTSALEVALALGKPYVKGFVKNRYIFRTFIMPNQKKRQEGVRRKLNPMEKKFAGKNVLLVDDSIVRGTTSREIVLMAREAGARKVFFTSCSPPITNAHIYGIDLAVPSELIAHARTPESIAAHIGADAVIYQTLPDLITAVSAAADPNDPNTPKEFEVGVFCGKYITPVSEGYFEHLEEVRGKAAARKKASQIAMLGGPPPPPPVVIPDHSHADTEHLASHRYSDHKHWQEAQDNSPISANTATPALNGNSTLGGMAGRLLDGLVKPNGNGTQAQDQPQQQQQQRPQQRHRAPVTPGADGVEKSQDISLHNLNDYANP